LRRLFEPVVAKKAKRSLPIWVQKPFLALRLAHFKRRATARRYLSACIVSGKPGRAGKASAQHLAGFGEKGILLCAQ